MRIRCLFGHDWNEWYIYRYTKTRERWCINCKKTVKEPLPPLEFQIGEILKLDISREEINRKLDNLTDWYGYRKSTLAILTLARKHFRVHTREARYVTRERLVQYYVYHKKPLTALSKYAKLATDKYINL